MSKGGKKEHSLPLPLTSPKLIHSLLHKSLSETTQHSLIDEILSIIFFASVFHF